jgi:outer membrane protein OmpA-like peptidoglycan-associated protein
MEPHHAVITTVLFGIACAAGAMAAERETLSFGETAPAAEQVTHFLFPEAECDNAQYQCLAVRPSTERSIGIELKFHTASAELTPEAAKQLETLGKVLASRSGKLAPGEIVIEGHADPRGTAELNRRLSEQRAQSVVKHLVSVYGVDPKVLRPVGRGSEQLKDAVHPDSQVNRRVELVRITIN